MTCSELIKRLEALKEIHGDLEVEYLNHEYHDGDEIETITICPVSRRKKVFMIE